MSSEVVNSPPNTQKSGFYWPLLNFGRSGAAQSCKTSHHDLLTSHVNIGQREQDLPLALVLGDATVTGFSMAKRSSHYERDVPRALGHWP